MRLTTVDRRAAVAVTAMTLCVGATAAGAASATPTVDPAPGPVAALVSGLVSSVSGAASRLAADAGTSSKPVEKAERVVPDDRSGAAPATVGADEPVSTPVPINTPDGLLMSYVVNASAPTAAQTRLVAAAVRRSGGVVVQAWPQVGVVVAHSTRSSFRRDVVARGGAAVASVGATRSVAVTEGTPSPATMSADAAASDLAASDAAASDAAASDATATDRREGRPASSPLPDFGAAASDDVALDPLETDQWDMALIKADEAHELTDGSPSVVVGVLDSGVDADHPDLVANLDVADSVNCTDAGRPDRSATGWQPTTSDHGTHVAGTIAAARNGVGIVGVAPDARIASVKVVSDDGLIYPEYAVCGFMWSGLRGLDVTNNSYYVDPFQFYCSDQPDQAAAKEAVRRAVAWSTKRGVVHVAAAGNSAYDLANKTTDDTSPDDGTPVDRVINNACEDIPTELDGVVTVSSLAQVGNTLGSSLSSFSNRGLGKIDVAAPGSSILSTIVTDNGYGLKSGTSMASPHVAGVLALMKGRHPTWAPARLIAQLRAQADDKACPASTPNAPCTGTKSDNSYFGQGVVDALQAVQ